MTSEKNEENDNFLIIFFHVCCGQTSGLSAENVGKLDDLYAHILKAARVIR